MDNYRLEINKLKNGFITRRNNDNPPSMVFMVLEDLIEYIKEFFEEKSDGNNTTTTRTG